MPNSISLMSVISAGGSLRVIPRLSRCLGQSLISTSHPSPFIHRQTQQCLHHSSYRTFLTTSPKPDDSRLEKLNSDLGRTLTTEYAHIRSEYETPRFPIVLAHGLLGFAELKLAANYLPPIHYWRGIKEALSAQGC